MPDGAIRRSSREGMLRPWDLRFIPFARTGRLGRGAWTDGGLGSEGDGDLAAHRAGLEVTQRVGHLLQWIGPFQAGGHPAGLDELGERAEITASLLGGMHGEP